LRGPGWVGYRAGKVCFVVAVVETDQLCRSLASLKPGDRGRITALLGEPSVRHRLLELGLTRGTIVEMIRVAPLGDPIELQLRGYRLSVRKAEAGVVLLESA